MAPVEKFVELPGRITLPYVEQGDSSGVPLLLLHGFLESWRAFDLLLPYLPESIHVFAVTQRGHGNASRPAHGYRPRDFAADAAALEAEGVPVQRGSFQEHMEVELVNDGPVTILLDGARQ